MIATASHVPSPEAAAAHPVAWGAYVTNGMYEAPKHIQFIAKQLMRIHTGEAHRIVISCPPRHGKSFLVSRFFASWWLGTHPTHKIILVTMQERFSRRWGRAARDDFRAKAEELWGVTALSRASTAEWDVYRDGRPTDGSMSAVGAGGTITGKGADLVIVDDLIRNLAEAQNPTLREHQWEWFQSTVETRLEPPGRVVVLMTRWSHDDLIGRLQEQQKQGELGDDWTFINLPAICDEENDPLGRSPGEALWPERRTAAWLASKRKNVGPYVWEALYQGRPTPKSGNVFKASWFKEFTFSENKKVLAIPGHGTTRVEDLRLFATVDLAASKKRRADWTVIGVWGYHPGWGVLVLLDLERARLEGHEIVPMLTRMREVHKLPVLYVEREGTFLEEKLGSVVKNAAREGIPVKELRPEGDKEARAYAAQGPFAAGQVFLPARAPWLEEYKTELLTFPEGKHDDQVDVTTYAVGIYRELVASHARINSPHDDGGGWSSGAREKPWI